MREPVDIVPLVAELLHRLAHDLRTPLAVISNELHYISTLVPKRECDRAVARCHDIDEEIATLSSFPRTPLQPLALTPAELGRALEQLGVVVESVSCEVSSTPSAKAPSALWVDPVWLAAFVRVASRSLRAPLERGSVGPALVCQLLVDRISVSLPEEQPTQGLESATKDSLKDQPAGMVLQIMASAMRSEVCYASRRIELMLQTQRPETAHPGAPERV
jgi:signal transduction histidine kinase